MNKLELANQIKQFMYTTTLPFDDNSNVRIISRAYLKTVLANAFSNNSNSSPYAIIAGDFDKLNNFNSKYGTDNGDKAICSCLETIYQTLPNNAILTRYAGDEFIFIIPGVTDKSVLNDYIQNITSNISNNTNQNHGLSITLSPILSSEANSLLEMYEKADADIEDQKLSKDKSSGAFDSSFISSFNTFFSSLRLSGDFEFYVEHVKKIMTDSIDVSMDLVKEYKENGFISSRAEDSIGDSFIGLFTQEEAQKLNGFFSSSDVNSNAIESLDSINDQTLKVLAKRLIFNRHSKAFNKEYFYNFLTKNLSDDKKFNMTLLSLSGLKISNLINGHMQTDRCLYHAFERVSSSLDDELFLNNHSFGTDPSLSYKIAVGGGDLLYITPENVDFDIGDNISSINKYDKLLKYVVSKSSNSITPNKMIDFLSSATKDASTKKDLFKKDLLSGNNTKNILRVCLSKNIESFCKSHPDYDDSKVFKEFLKNQSSAILDLTVQANQLIENSDHSDDIDNNFSSLDKDDISE